MKTPPLPATISLMTADPTNATLVYREDLTDALSIVRVRPDSGRVPDFVPGQFVRLGLPRPQPPGHAGRVRYTRRAYSIGSSPASTDALEFFVVRIEEGELTPKLWQIEVGQRLWMDTTAKGEFRIDLAPAGKNLIMVSTGTGIAPFVSMLRHYRGENRWQNFILINGVRHAHDLGYRQELEVIAAEDPTVHYIPIVSRETPGDNWPGRRGRVQTLLEDDVLPELAGVPLDPAMSHVFLCGNPAMIDATEILLTARGFTTDQRDKLGNLHFERYW